MSLDMIETLWQSIEVIESQKYLAFLRISDFPHLKSSERNKIHKELYKKSYPFQEKRKVTWEDLQRIMRGAE